jgi:hypothetical protein
MSRRLDDRPVRQTVSGHVEFGANDQCHVAVFKIAHLGDRFPGSAQRPAPAAGSRQPIHDVAEREAPAQLGNEGIADG